MRNGHNGMHHGRRRRRRHRRHRRRHFVKLNEKSGGK